LCYILKENSGAKGLKTSEIKVCHNFNGTGIKKEIKNADSNLQIPDQLKSSLTNALCCYETDRNACVLWRVV
jgi:hypothetical protein